MLPQLGFRLGTDNIDYEDALALARTGAIPYPPAFLRAIFSGRHDSVPTASALAGCMRRFELKRTTPYYVKPEDMIALTGGNGWHHLLEQAGKDEGGDQELRLKGVLHFDLPAPFDRIEITGTSDNIRPPEIMDWKTTGYIPKNFTGRVSHFAQANVYNWLYAQTFPDAAPLERFRIFYIGNNKETANIVGDLKPLAHTEDWIRRRIGAWSEPVSRGALPDPVATLWETDPKKRGECLWCECRSACEAALADTAVNDA